MCPRPKGWTDEQWQAYNNRRGGRMMLMGEYMQRVMATTGVSQHEAFNQMEDDLYSGEFSLENGLDEATERYLVARRERYGY